MRRAVAALLFDVFGGVNLLLPEEALLVLGVLLPEFERAGCGVQERMIDHSIAGDDQNIYEGVSMRQRQRGMQAAIVSYNRTS